MNTRRPGSSFYITEVELVKLTGRERHNAQIRWLLEHGFRPHRRADGLVLVKREDYDEYKEYKDGKKGQQQDDPDGPRDAPDFSTLTD